MTALTYTLQQLQDAFQETSQDATRNRISLLERNHSFPPRLPGHTARWSRPAVDDWFRSWGQLRTAEAEPSLVLTLQRDLERTYG